jgi:phosphoribosylamine--glycine ligase
MRVLVVGGGGREHALAWKLAQSPSVEKLYAAPGNPGMKAFSELVPIGVLDIGEIVAFGEREKIDLVVVGPEAPLAEGLADRLRERGIFCFGPGAKGARLESSKRYARDFMTRHGVPSPSYHAFTSLEEAKRHIEALEEGPVVVKANGLAQGKGAVVASNKDEAAAIAEEMMKGGLGKAGEEILIEECLVGEEVSLLAFVDGKTILPMPPAQDHKRVGEGDSGPNTGGMGAYAPVSAYTPQIAAQVEETILRPIQEGLRKECIDYRGCLYIGLMLTSGPDGKPVAKVIEFNSRFGDPETQALMPLLKSDLFEILYACAKGNCKGRSPRWSDESAVCVVMASRGYPEPYGTGYAIEEDPLPEDVEKDSWVFHAGTKESEDGKILTSGGRVLGVTAKNPTLEKALRLAYARADAIRFEGSFFRRDIAHRELARIRAKEDAGARKPSKNKL